MKIKSIIKRVGLLGLVLLLVLPGLAMGQCENRCTLPPKKDRRECSIVVDANNGTIIEGSIRLPDKCDQVTVYYVNKNPFKYSYAFSSTFVPFDTEAALALLKLISGDFGKALTSVMGQTSSMATPSNPGDIQCTGANGTASQALIKRANDLKDESEKLAKEIDTAVKSYSSHKDKQARFFTDTEDDNAFKAGSSSCTELCTTARNLVAAFDELADLDKLVAGIKSFQDKLSKLEQDLNAFNPTGDDATACKLGTKNAVAPLVKSGNEDSTKYSAALDTLKQTRTTLEKTAKLIRNGVNSDLIEVVPAQRDDSRGGKLTLTIARKNLRNPDSKLDDRSVTLLIGEPNLFFTAGIGFSTVSDRRVIRQAALVSDGKGGTKLGTVFGFDENSNFKPSGLFMLTAPLKRFGNGMTIGPSAGLVLSSRNGTTEPEFIAGLSLGLLRNTVFISGGFHAARRESLASGFKIGQEVPADLKDPLPLEKRFTGGAMFSITYRIK